MNQQNFSANLSMQPMPESLWAATAQPFNAPQLESDFKVDVLVVGGGYTGLNCALKLRQSGLQVALLESSSIGYGGSGRNVGLVNAGLWMPPDEINHIIGDDFGNRLYSELSSAPKRVFELIEQHQIDCELERNGTLQLARSRRGVKELEIRFAQLQGRNEPVTWLDGAATEQALGSSFYQYAIHDARAGTIQPLAYARGLARACLAEGVSLYESSPVQQLQIQGGVWQAKTAKGSINAGKVVLATNGYSSNLLPKMQQSFTPVHYFQLASAPLTQQQQAIILAGKQGCWDTGLVMTSLRLDRSGRLIIGSVGKITDGRSSAYLAQWGARVVARIFPFLPKQEWQYTWSGQIAYSDDHLPHLHQLAPGLVTVMGYSGRGIGPGTVMGQWLAQFVSGANIEDLPLPVTEPQSINYRNIKQHYYRFGSDLYHSVHPL